MSDERATGIILRIRPLSDTSVIVHWLTSEHGRIATVGKGARRPTSPFHGRLDLGFAGDLSFVRARRSSLHTLREINVTATYPGVRADYRKLVQFSYGVALLERSTEEDTPVPEIYGVWADWLAHLDFHAAQPRTVYALEARLLASHGFNPLAAAEPLGDDARQLLIQLLVAPWERVPELVASAGAIRAVKAFLGLRLSDAFGRVLETRQQAVGTL
ncbi:MAG TPA: DNA repair protein RecO [Verrucomicrobiota bacterium]|nr:DNA repair protein RecO [Verrucomicrobiales bacterium]HRI16347.1 DNA repair protein RecO [Verrucomicrobiota bacterium]